MFLPAGWKMWIEPGNLKMVFVGSETRFEEAIKFSAFTPQQINWTDAVKYFNDGWRLEVLAFNKKYDWEENNDL